MKQNIFFATFMLALTLVFTLFNQGVGDIYSDKSTQDQMILTMKDEVARTELQNRLLAEQLYDYQQNVAQVLGREKIKSTDSLAKLDLLTASRIPASEKSGSGALTLLASGNSFFDQKKYREAVGVFDRLIADFPSSPQALQARFLRAESLYLMGELDLAVEEIEMMISQFPEYSLTGYLMVRLSQILHHRKRSAEAAELLNFVRRTFPNDSQLQSQVKILGEKIRVL